MTQTKQSLTKFLLICGAVAGPLFILVLLIQDYTRPGFDPRHDMLSLLSLGNLGWIQIANFITAGVLNLLYAVGLWRHMHGRKGGTWGPMLIGVYGAALVTVGVFRTDPASNFPPGIPTPAHTSWHAGIHGFGALFVFMSLSIALIVLSRMFAARKDRLWMAYCLLSAILMLCIFFAGFTSAQIGARTLRLGVLIGWMAASLVAVRLLQPRHQSTAQTFHLTNKP